jgi:hypothetical protein
MQENIEAKKCSCGRWPVTYISVKTHKQYMKCHNCSNATKVYGHDEKNKMTLEWNESSRERKVS